MGNGTPGMNQSNLAKKGNVYGVQGGTLNVTNTAGPTRRGPRVDTKVLLVTLPVDVAFFFYGMLSYTGQNTTGDDWRAGIFLFLFLATAAMLGRWVRRRI
jgi:hypothetical protein